MFNWFGSEAGKVGAMLEMSLNPTESPDIGDITADMMRGFAQQCQHINEEYGVPIYMRWAHEMNGDWYPWGNTPTAFIASFRQFTTIMREYTNMTAMVWAPNSGIDYPFIGGGARPSPAPGGVDFAVLDTNNDGVIDIYDDPYTPFYPGDDVVDWVGLSLYYYPYCTNNCPLPSNSFTAELTSIGHPSTPLVNAAAWNNVHNFYANFAQARNKPMMLPETGSPYIHEWANRTGAATELTIKQSWWNQLVSPATIANFPQLKLFVQFEEQKPLAVNGVPALRDWRVTNSTSMLGWWNGFVQGQQGVVKSADELVYGCDGSIMGGVKPARVPSTLGRPSDGPPAPGGATATNSGVNVGVGLGAVGLMVAALI
ncbi:hypothetical protein HDU98_001117 [Podochytrium sp. JEL0797]|nr:hypothetical protein HDU98_001117 [Podochytrium sp. JEL0797]